jgi:hypothetical protein
VEDADTRIPTTDDVGEMEFTLLNDQFDTNSDPQSNFPVEEVYRS